MPLPETIRVKLSSEAAGAISLTPVVVEEIPLRDLIERMLGVAGKDPARIAEMLRRGTLVSGASRFRWTGWDADPEALGSLLAAFPESEPERPFAGERAVSAALVGPRCRLEIAREAGERRRLFRRRSFWDELTALAVGAPLEYLEYSYDRRADAYRLRLEPSARETLRGAAGLLTYSALAAQVGAADFATVEYYVVRPA